VSHQQTGEGRQSRPALARGDASRQAGLSGAAAADAMASERLVFIDKGFNLEASPRPSAAADQPRQAAGRPTATAAIGMTRRDCGALFDGDEFSRVPFVTFLSALFSFLSRRWFSFRLCLRMLGARRQRRIARSQFLNLSGQNIHLLGQSIHLVKQSQDKRFNSGRHFSFEFWWDLAQAGVGTENRPPSPEQVLDSLQRPVNAYGSSECGIAD